MSGLIRVACGGKWSRVALSLIALEMIMHMTARERKLCSTQKQANRIIAFKVAEFFERQIQKCFDENIFESSNVGCKSPAVNAMV